MEEICSSETSVETERTTWRHIPEDDTLHHFQQFPFCCACIWCHCNQLSCVVCWPLCSSGWLLLLNYTVITSQYLYLMAVFLMENLWAYSVCVVQFPAFLKGWS
jgi:hypothetical protein